MRPAKRSTPLEELQPPFSLFELLTHDVFDVFHTHLAPEAKANLSCTCKTARDGILRQVKRAWPADGAGGPPADNSPTHLATRLQYLTRTLPTLESLSLFNEAEQRAQHLNLAAANVIARGRSDCWFLWRPAGAPPLATRLRGLVLRGVRVGPEELRALFSVRWPRLESLDLAATMPHLRPNQVVEAAQTLAAARLPRLRSLGLERAGLTPRAILFLAASARFPLERLDLSGNRVRSPYRNVFSWNTACAPALAALAASPLARTLRSLDVTKMGLADSTINALARGGGGWPALAEFVTDDGWPEEAVGVLAMVPAVMPFLDKVELRSPLLTPQLEAALAARPALKHLSLYNEDASFHNTCTLGRCTAWPHLTRLEFYNCYTLLNHAHFPNTINLDLNCVPLLRAVVGDGGAGFANARAWFCRLRRLKWRIRHTNPFTYTAAPSDELAWRTVIDDLHFPGRFWLRSRLDLHVLWPCMMQGRSCRQWTFPRPPNLTKEFCCAMGRIDFSKCWVQSE